MQQHNLSTNTSQGPPYDRNIADLENRLFNETPDTTRRIHQHGYEDLMKLRNPTSYVLKSEENKGLFKNLPLLNENNNIPIKDCEFQENISRYFKCPCRGNEFSSIPQQVDNNNTDQNINRSYPSNSFNPREPILRNNNYEPNQSGLSHTENKPNIPSKPLKSILRNTMYRPDIENNQDFSIRQVSFEPQCQICASNSIVFKRISNSRLPGQMEWTPQYITNDINANQNYFQPSRPVINNSPCSSQNTPFCSQNTPIPNVSENPDPFKYQYLHINSNFIPEEKTQTTYVNDPNHNLNYLNYNSRPNISDIQESSNPQKYENVFTPRYTSKININEIQRPNPEPVIQITPNYQLIYQNSNQQDTNNVNKTPFTTATNYNLNQFEKYSDKYANTPQGNYGNQRDTSQFIQLNEKLNNILHPQTQQRETVYVGEKEPVATHPLVQTVYSSQPCYAIPADMAYFHNDRFELYVDAKLLMPEKLRVNVLPERIELYGCTEYYAIGSKSLLEIMRVYDLPARIAPEKTNCILNTEGILFITAFWEKPL